MTQDELIQDLINRVATLEQQVQELNEKLVQHTTTPHMRVTPDGNLAHTA